MPPDAPPKRTRRRANPIHRSRVLAVEHLACNSVGDHYKSCPLIRLKGHWLARAGFLAGSRVLVAVRPGRLTITPAK